MSNSVVTTDVVLQVMKTIEPVGYVTRQHKNSTLVADGGKIISASFLINEDVIGHSLYTEIQMREAIEQTLAQVKKEIQ